MYFLSKYHFLIWSLYLKSCTVSKEKEKNLKKIKWMTKIIKSWFDNKRLKKTVECNQLLNIDLTTLKTVIFSYCTFFQTHEKKLLPTTKIHKCTGNFQKSILNESFEWLISHFFTQLFYFFPGIPVNTVLLFFSKKN